MYSSRLHLVVAFLGVLLLLATGCARPSIPEIPELNGTVEVYVTDVPPTDEVTSIVVTVSKIEIHKTPTSIDMQQVQEGDTTSNQTPEQGEEEQVEDSEGEWIAVDLSDNATTFDLLKIKGIEQLLGSGQMEAGKYTQLRLVIDKVEVAIGGRELEEAKIPSEEIKIVRPFTVVAGETTELVLDFDADKSIIAPQALEAVDSDQPITAARTGGILVSPVVRLIVR